MELSDLTSGNNKVKWFKYLVPGQDEGKRNDLMSFFSDKELALGVIVCAITSLGNHVFALFPNYVAFAKYQQSLPLEKRCFFEIILAGRQKSHYDLDIDLKKYPDANPDTIFQLFITTLITVYKEVYNIDLNLETDILPFTSHGATKRSFHVVVDNYCHTCNLEAKAIYDEVMKREGPALHDFLDSSVYSKKQQFRIVGSQKMGSGRIKTLYSPWPYQDQNITYLYREEPHNPGHRLVLELEASLVSFTSHCKLLPNLISDDKKYPSYNGGSSGEWVGDADDLHSDTIKAVLNMLAKKGNTNIHADNFPYEVRGVVGTLILLKRLRPSRCQVCKRIHENENPYILVVTNEDTNCRHVYFDCRRAEGNKLYLGILDEEQNGKILPDAPFLIEQKEQLSKLGYLDILNKMSSTAGIPMKEVRNVRNTKKGTFTSPSEKTIVLRASSPRDAKSPRTN